MSKREGGIAMRLTIAAIAGFIAGVMGSVLIMTFFGSKHNGPSAKEWGEFPTTPKVELLEGGLLVRLLEDFVYVDPAMKIWTAKKDLVSDGASIPRAFWSIIGGPLDGEYRNAALVHDDACDSKKEKWEDVHLMFYRACRCGGLPETKAKVMYAAVYFFGPHWQLRTVEETKQVFDMQGAALHMTVKQTVVHAITPTQQPDPEIRTKLEKYVNDKNPTLEELRKIDPKNL